MTIQRAEEPLARDGVSYQRDRRQFRKVAPKRLFETRYTVPRLPLPEVDPSAWPLAIELPHRRRRRHHRHGLVQAALFTMKD